MEKHPELFGHFSENQESHMDISEWEKIYKEPDQLDKLKSQAAQHALNYYPKSRVKTVLEMYYIYNNSLQEIQKFLKHKNNVNTRVYIFRANERVIEYYNTYVKVPVNMENHKIVLKKVLGYGSLTKECLKLKNLETNQEYWVDGNNVILDEDIQDLLDHSEKYGEWDYIDVKNGKGSI